MTKHAMATLTSLNVGLPADVQWHGQTVHTGIWKRAVAGPRMVRRLNVDGDGQGDLGGHGGEQRAVLVYQLDSYRHWEQYFGVDRLAAGSFGENFTVDGLPDDEVCIGDRYRIGDAELEVTQPRVTCFRVGMRLGRPDLPRLLVAHHRPGFYLRVTTEGAVQAGDTITLVARGRHAMTVAAADALLYLPAPDLAQVRLAAAIPALSPGWRGSFDAMLTPETGKSTVHKADAVDPGWGGFRPLAVSRLVTESDDVISVRLQAPDLAPLPRPLPGQFVTIRLPATAGPSPVRSYSLSSSPDDRDYRISIKLDERGLASRWLHENLTVGAMLDVAAPRGDFVLDDGPEPVVLVSAGIGVTPVLAMLHQLVARRSTRPVWWLHSNSDISRRPFADEAQLLLAQLPDAHVRLFHTGPPPVSTPVDAVTGRLSPATLADIGLPSTAQVYVCGPDPFMVATTAALTTLGIAAEHIHTELFGALAPINPGVVRTRSPVPHQPTGPAGTGPSITFARSGLTVRWASGRDESLLDLAERCDVPTRWSCRSGVCHTCVTAVLTGTASYVTAPLVPPAPDRVLVCCAEPAGDMVLDL